MHSINAFRKTKARAKRILDMAPKPPAGFFKRDAALAKLEKAAPYLISFAIAGAWMYSESFSRNENLFVLNESYDAKLINWLEYYPPYIKYYLFGNVNLLQMSILATAIKGVWEEFVPRRK